MKTLGMFAKQPVPGRVKTRLAADWGNDRAAGLYEAFLRDLLDRLGDRRPEGLDAGIQRVLGFSPDEATAHAWFEAAAASRWQLWPQPDGDLGGRIAAFFAGHTAGPECSAVLIGSDSPTLPVAYVRDAFERLNSVDVVVCPASDGGYCLIGLRSGFDAAPLFRDLEWSSSRVLGQTAERVRESGLSLELLPVWYDVDSVESVKMLQGHLRASAVAGVDQGLKFTSAFLDAPVDRTAVR
ncbi:MAG: TIGR04282 family arsenosugar biosynthesis glycosyltransferase [Planctomycetaceae bacterium]